MNTTIDLMQKYAKFSGKYCMYISFLAWCDKYSFDDLFKAAPYLDDEKYSQVVIDEEGILEFDTEEEMNHYYNLTVGRDGPTKLNSYNGPCTVYALTCGNDGNTRNENT
mgnify:CR=1 FL=1